MFGSRRLNTLSRVECSQPDPHLDQTTAEDLSQYAQSRRMLSAGTGITTPFTRTVVYVSIRSVASNALSQIVVNLVEVEILRLNTLSRVECSQPQELAIPSRPTSLSQYAQSRRMLSAHSTRSLRCTVLTSQYAQSRRMLSASGLSWLLREYESLNTLSRVECSQPSFCTPSAVCGKPSLNTLSRVECSQPHSSRAFSFDEHGESQYAQSRRMLSAA